MYVVEALAAHALEDEVTVVAHLEAETVASEGAVLPYLSVVLHPEVDALEPMEVSLVEVLLLLLLGFFVRFFLDLFDDGAWQLQRQRLQRTEHEVKIQAGEEDDVDGNQSQVVEDGNVGVEDYGESHGDAVAQEVAWHVGVACYAPGQEEDVDDVVDAQSERAEAEQDVAAQDVFYQVLACVDIDDAAAHQTCNEVYGEQYEDGSGIAHHTLPLQESRHGNVQGVDALQVAGAEQGQKHARMEDAGLGCGYGVGVVASEEHDTEENAVHPRQAEVLHAVSGEDRCHGCYDKMYDGRPEKGQEKDVFVHAIRAFTPAKLALLC